MIITYGCIDIVIKRNSLENIKKDLSQELISKYNVSPDNYDKDLIAIRGGMSDNDSIETIKELENKYGLTHMEKGKAKDFAVVKYYLSLVDKCDWLEIVNLNEDKIISHKHYTKGKYFKYNNRGDKMKDRLKETQTFEKCLHNYICDCLLYEIPYVARLDKLYNTNLRVMPYQERLEEFKSCFASEGKKMIVEYFTLSYISHGVKTSGLIDDADHTKLIPLIEDMFIEKD